jgi:hypothetical protein
MSVVMTAQARVDGCSARIEPVRAVTRCATEASIVSFAVHRSPRVADPERVEPQGFAHSVPSPLVTLLLPFVTAPARRARGSFHPAFLSGVSGVTSRTIHAVLRVPALEPMTELVSGQHASRRRVRVARGEPLGGFGLRARSPERLRGDPGLVEVSTQKVFVQRPVVVEVVAARVGAGVERKSPVTRALIGDGLVTAVTVVAGKTEPHRRGDLGSVFAMTGHAVSSVERVDALCVARIGELALRVRVACFDELGAVTRHTGCLHCVSIAERFRVTTLTAELDLVVAVRRGSRQVNAARTSVEGIGESERNHG